MTRAASALLMSVGALLCLSAAPWMAQPAHAQTGHAKAKPRPSKVEPRNLLQHWVHSREEEQPGHAARIFRPARSREFPPSRFRMAYKLARNGVCEWYYLSPDDAHRFKVGRWKLGARDRTLLEITEDGATTRYRIVELSKQLLRLAPAAPTARK